MKRNMLFGAGAAALACLLGGCQLAVPQGAAEQDTLIGGYATWESIPYFSEHFLSGDDSPSACTQTGAVPTGRRAHSGGISSPL